MCVGCKRRLQIARHVEFEAHSAVVDLICEVGRARLNAALLNHPFYPFKAVVMIAPSGIPIPLLHAVWLHH